MKEYYINEITYGNRIACNTWFEKGFVGCEEEFIKEFNLSYSDYMLYSKYIIEALVYWIEKEKEMLSGTPDENSDLQNRYFKHCGDYPTILRIAKDFGQDPDTVLTWKYGKVFGILYTYKCEAEYEKALYKRLNKKV